MRELRHFLRFVLPYAPACPDPMAEQHILSAAREFCEATRCWRETDTIPIHGHAIEVVCVPPYAALHEIEDAKFDGRPLERVAFKDSLHGAEGLPEQIMQTSMNTISIAPAACGQLTISLFLKPALDTDILPDFLYEQWAEQIGYGAVARILDLPDMPFSNPSAALTYRVLFERAKDSNFNASRRGQQRAPVRTRSRFF